MTLTITAKVTDAVGTVFTTTATASQSQPTAGFPDDSNTGVPPGTVLTPNGISRITTSGTKLTAQDLGHLVISASNVTLENCRITETSPSAYAVVEIAGAGATIRNCEIIGMGTKATAPNQEGIRTYVEGVMLDGVKIHEVGHSIHLNGSCTIKNCYFYNFNCHSATHIDGIFCDNLSSATVTNNTIDLTVHSTNMTSAIFLQPGNDSMTIKNFNCDGNHLVYGGYTVAGDLRLGGNVSNISYTNNAIGKGVYGYKSFGFSVNWAGNYDHKTNAPV